MAAHKGRPSRDKFRAAGVKPAVFFVDRCGRGDSLVPALATLSSGLAGEA